MKHYFVKIAIKTKHGKIVKYFGKNGVLVERNENGTFSIDDIEKNAFTDNTQAIKAIFDIAKNEKYDNVIEKYFLIIEAKKNIDEKIKKWDIGYYKVPIDKSTIAFFKKHNATVVNDLIDDIEVHLYEGHYDPRFTIEVQRLLELFRR